MATTSNSLEITSLNARLTVSEKRIKIITREIKDIKTQLNAYATAIGSAPIQSTSTSLDITSLSARLTEAKKRLKILTCEIKDIKTKLNAIGSAPIPSTSRQFSSTATRSLNSENRVENLNPPKRKKIDFPMEGGYVVVYTDGACENNGKINARAGIGVWFSDNHELNLKKPVNGRATNNTAEIQACTEAVKIALKYGVKKLLIKTDSQFVINSMTEWIIKWKMNSWKLSSGGDVKNKEEFILLDTQLKLLDDIKWDHVIGHSGIKGNEEADKLARLGAKDYVPK